MDLEELKKFRSLIQEDKWNIIFWDDQAKPILERDGTQKKNPKGEPMFSFPQPRADVYTGPKLPDHADRFGGKWNAPENKQVCHFHPETPNVYEKNINWKGDIEVISRLPEILDFAIQELSKGENNVSDLG